jgi:translation initiation factor 2B subunit (eIF-2B alpha/beta/delta family)
MIEAFASLDISTLELHILESRPLFEGVNFASSILSKFREQFKDSTDRLDVSLFTDAAAAIAVKGADIVLLGADRISKAKGVSNKTGSLPLVLAAKHVTPSAKIVVLSELEKVNGESGIIDDEKHEDNDPREVLRTWKADGVKDVGRVEAALSSGQESGSTVTVRNVYFEWIPLSFIDAFVSGEGVLSDTRIHEKANQQDELARWYFDSIPVRY